MRTHHIYCISGWPTIIGIICNRENLIDVFIVFQHSLTHLLTHSTPLLIHTCTHHTHTNTILSLSLPLTHSLSWSCDSISPWCLHKQADPFSRWATWPHPSPPVLRPMVQRTPVCTRRQFEGAIVRGHGFTERPTKERASETKRHRKPVRTYTWLCV